MAVVTTGQLRQVADPNRPSDHAFETPADAVGRVLHPLGESQHVMIVGGPTKPNNDVYWQVADSAFPGCCAPFGWVRATNGADQSVIEPFDPQCPDPLEPLSGNELLALGVMEAESCFGTADFKLRGEVRCARPVVEQFLSITGPDWANDETLCDIDQAVSLYGDAATGLLARAGVGEVFDADVELTAHFDDPSADDCRWAPGNSRPMSVANAPVDTAQFACRMSVYVTEATPSAHE
jgi:hypothetical protein